MSELNSPSFIYDIDIIFQTTLSHFLRQSLPRRGIVFFFCFCFRLLRVCHVSNQGVNEPTVIHRRVLWTDQFGRSFRVSQSNNVIQCKPCCQCKNLFLLKWGYIYLEKSSKELVVDRELV